MLVIVFLNMCLQVLGSILGGPSGHFLQTIHPVKNNFRTKYKLNLCCEFCGIGISDQEHQLSCPVINKFLPEIADSNVIYQDLFGNAEKQLKFIKIYTKIARQREVLLESLNM